PGPQRTYWNGCAEQVLHRKPTFQIRSRAQRKRTARIASIADPATGGVGCDAGHNLAGAYSMKMKDGGGRRTVPAGRGQPVGRDRPAGEWAGANRLSPQTEVPYPASACFSFQKSAN